METELKLKGLKKDSPYELVIRMYLAQLDKDWRDSDYMVQGFIPRCASMIGKLKEEGEYVLVDSRRYDSGLGEVKLHAVELTSSKPKEVDPSAGALPPNELVVDGHWEINHRLASSMEHHHMSMDHLPSFRSVDGQIIGVEASLRWRDRSEVVPPHEYMPALNDSTLMDLNIYCYRRVLREIVEFDIKVPVSINIAPACFADPDFEGFLAREAALWGVKARLLTLEIATNSDFLNIEAVIKVLRRLSEVGFKFSIDDFGSGYANLERVKDLPIDILKLDRSLSCTLMDDEKIADIAKRIVTFGKEVNIDVIAAGIEDGATMEQLRQWGCQAGHGTYLGLPLAIADLNKVRDIHETVALI